jgi:uncharacterized protein (TIGR03437 family)
MTRIFKTIIASLLLCGAGMCATITTTLTVTNASGPLAGTSITVTGPATLSGGVGSGTFSGTLGLTGGDATFVITLTTGDKINGTIAIPPTALAGGSLAGVTAKITGGTGAYSGATGNLTLSSGSVAIGLTVTMTFSAAGTITTGGGGGPVGPTPPSITTVQNNYGLISPGLPNYGLAPSTLFFIKGDNLSSVTSPDLISSASPGLPTTQNNVTVTVTSGGQTLQCPLYYLSPNQIDAVLPGGTPIGNATITVTNNGATSAGFQVPVVQSAFGILSYNGSLAAAYDANNQILTASNSANPGQVIVLWGSGIGRDPQDDDKLYPQKQTDLTDIPVQAYVGGVPATLAYRGRSQFPGLDQVVLTIPSNVPTGCYVSLALVNGNVVSNSVTIPVAASGRTCTDNGAALDPGVFNTLAGKTTIKEGFVVVSQSTDIRSAGNQTTSSVGGFFQSVSGIGGAQGAANQVSIGSCIVYNSLTTGTSTGTTVGLDAGASVNVTGPAGSLSLSPLSVPGFSLPGFYAPPGGTVPASFIPTGGGTFTFDNGSGGKDVGHFNVGMSVPAAFTWANASSISSVTRSSGVTVTWSGGAPGTLAQITGDSTANIGGKSTTVSFTCQAPVSAGSFTVPVPVLLALPAGSGSLTVTDATNFQTFTATGLDLGLAVAENIWSKSLSYQ